MGLVRQQRGKRKRKRGTDLLESIDELITTFLREIVLGQELLASIEVVVCVVFMLLGNAVEHVILHDTSALSPTTEGRSQKAHPHTEDLLLQTLLRDLPLLFLGNAFRVAFDILRMRLSLLLAGRRQIASSLLTLRLQLADTLTFPSGSLDTHTLDGMAGDGVLGAGDLLLHDGFIGVFGRVELIMRRCVIDSCQSLRIGCDGAGCL